MKLNVRVDTSALKRKLRETLRASPAAREAAVKAMAREVMAEVVREWPRDTNRSVNGWALAANKAEVGPLPVRPYNKASWHDRIFRVLERRARFWTFRVARYEREGRRDVWYRRAVRARDRAVLQLERMADTPHQAVIAFNLFGGGRDPTVRHRIYGGTGRVERLASRTFVHLHNLEPHTTVVESRFGVLRRAQARFLGLGLRRAGKRYLEQLRRAGV